MLSNMKLYTQHPFWKAEALHFGLEENSNENDAPEWWLSATVQAKLTF